MTAGRSPRRSADTQDVLVSIKHICLYPVVNFSDTKPVLDCTMLLVKQTSMFVRVYSLFTNVNYCNTAVREFSLPGQPVEFREEAQASGSDNKPFRLKRVTHTTNAASL